MKLDYFENKVVYVDVWGTRCGPCLREFKYASSLKERFEDESVVFLYLCSPYTVTWDAENAKRWRKLVYENELTGIHFYVSAECYEQGFYQKYESIYRDIGMYMIPRYLLVNKAGEIVDFDAPKPSDEKLLYDKIELLVEE